MSVVVLLSGTINMQMPFLRKESEKDNVQVALDKKVSGKHKKTLKKVLNSDARGNVSLKELVGLLTNLGAVDRTKENKGHKLFLLEHGGQKKIFDFPDPHPEKTLKPAYVDKARKNLESLMELDKEGE